jgi:putative transposase
MGRQRFTAESIVCKLREAEIDLSRGQMLAQTCKKIGVCEQAYYRWRKEYGGLRLDQAKHLRELGRENVRLKKLVAEQALEISILKEAASGNL